MFAKRALCKAQLYYYRGVFSGFLKGRFLRVYLKAAVQEDPFPRSICAGALTPSVRR
jgi:hypothetical protein